MQIAILMANTDESNFASQHPSDDENFIDILSCVRSNWGYEVFNVTHQIFPKSLDKFDGIIITGSPASANDKNLWIEELLIIIRSSIDKKIPIFGSCFGHQVIAKALGSNIIKNPNGWSFGLVKTQIVADAPWIAGLEKETLVYAAHMEQVKELPNGSKLLFKTDGCEIAGFSIENSIFTTQYHPEMSGQFMEALTEELSCELGKELTESARSSLNKNAHTIKFAESIAQFFEKLST